MSHRKVHSQCTIPFQWEEIPGVPKSNSVHHPFNNLPPTDHHYCYDFSPKVRELNIPLPPPCRVSSMHNKRSSSFRASRSGLAKRDQDPFVAALKECTKGSRSGKPATGRKNVGGGTTDVGLKGRKSRFCSFSCRRSDDVAVDNLLRLANLSPLPRGRSTYGGLC